MLVLTSGIALDGLYAVMVPNIGGMYFTHPRKGNRVEALALWRKQGKESQDPHARNKDYLKYSS